MGREVGIISLCSINNGRLWLLLNGSVSCLCLQKQFIDINALIRQLPTSFDYYTSIKEQVAVLLTSVYKDGNFILKKDQEL